MTTAHASEARSLYDKRSSSYDNSWHPELAADFVGWVAPKPGQRFLDLACGTGLITLLAKKAVGSSGTVVGVDISPGMMAEGKRKAREQGLEGITWIEHDISDLSDVPEVSESQWDIVSVCSALPLLEHPAAAIQGWKKVLKRGGTLIVDMVTEDETVQKLMTVQVRNDLGMPMQFLAGRTWVAGPEFLVDMVRKEGLAVDKNFRTRSYVPDRFYGSDEAEEVFERASHFTYKEFLVQGRQDEARASFVKRFKENLNEDGKFHDRHSVYVVIARRDG